MSTVIKETKLVGGMHSVSDTAQGNIEIHILINCRDLMADSPICISILLGYSPTQMVSFISLLLWIVLVDGLFTLLFLILSLKLSEKVTLDN